MEENQQPPMTFTWRGALLGLVAYLVVAAIVAIVFLRSA
jgi:hypothetical protein